MPPGKPQGTLIQLDADMLDVPLDNTEIAVDTDISEDIYKGWVELPKCGAAGAKDEVKLMAGLENASVATC